MSEQELKQNLFFLMGRLFQDARTRLDGIFKEDGLTRNEWLIFALLRLNQEGLSQAFIKDYLGLEVSYFSKVLNGLEDKGLIVREIDRFDRRNRIIKANPKAHAKTKKIYKIIRDQTEEIQADLSAKQIKELCNSLNSIAARLENLINND